MSPAGWALRCLLLTSAFPAAVVAARAHVPPEPFEGEITPALQAAVQKGLAWLAAAQDTEDGSFGRSSHYGRHVGITGLAGLAFLSDGHTPGRGRYGHVVDGCVRFILSSTSESGLIAAETSHGPMYGHGFATLFLAEVYGMTHNDEIEEALHKSIRLIIATQNDEGGWRYQPVRNDADISVTVCQIMALRAARNAGLHIPKSTIDAGIAYVRKLQNPDGGFRYMLNGGGSAFARSAAGAAAMQYAGIYSAEEINKALNYILSYMPSPEKNPGHYFYGHYYAAQTMFFAGENHWKRWWPAIRDELITKQSAGGPWRGQAGKEYGTAMALIILQMPKRLLPIFQR